MTVALLAIRLCASFSADGVRLNDGDVGGSVSYENVSISDRVVGNSVSVDKDESQR